jgi:hypothetical protein
LRIQEELKMHTSNLFSRLVREPLFHFLVLGAGLFLLYASLGNDGPEPADRIVVDEAEVGRLAEQFQRTWMRPPSRQELAGLAEDFVKEEILYREALALGLDQNDLVIRRRMRQKMEFLNTDLAEQRTPGEAELQAYLDGHAEQFRRPSRVSFDQIYIATAEASSDTARHRAETLLKTLDANPHTDWRKLGDPTLLPAGLSDASDREIASSFGNVLAESIADAPLQRWSGPYPSAYGLHLLRVTVRTPASLPALSEIRALVEREWRNGQRQRANDRFYQALRQRYSVEIRLPEAVAADKLAVHQP